MDTDEFRVQGKAMVEYMCGYMESLAERRVTPSVEPGYLRKLLPPEAPAQPESWDTIMADVDSKIMPGVSHRLVYLSGKSEKLSCAKLLVQFAAVQLDILVLKLVLLAIVGQ